MILHCVFCQIKSDVSDDDKQAVFDGLKTLCDELEGCIEFQCGPNRDYEMKSQDFTDGFVIKFVNREALAVYADHPTHQALGARLCDICHGGADGIIVFDLEA